MKSLSGTISILTLIVVVLIWLCPIYFMFTHSPWCILMFLISWLPASIVGQIGFVIADLLEGK